MSVRILVADDHKIVRDGLRSLLEKTPDMEVVAEGEDGRTTAQLARKLRPDVVIMDVAMPGLNGVEATRQIIATVPGVKVVALSMHSDTMYVSGMLSAGASGYLAKDCAIDELIGAIRTVMANKVYLSPDVAEVLAEDYVRQLSMTDSSVSSILTGREREVLQLVAEGRTTKEVASWLNVSVKTVETYRQRIMHKLGIHTIAELTKYAIREGLTSLES